MVLWAQFNCRQKQSYRLEQHRQIRADLGQNKAAKADGCWLLVTLALPSKLEILLMIMIIDKFWDKARINPKLPAFAECNYNNNDRNFISSRLWFKFILNKFIYLFYFLILARSKNLQGM